MDCKLPRLRRRRETCQHTGVEQLDAPLTVNQPPRHWGFESLHRYLSTCDEPLDDLIDAWHDGDGQNQTLWEYLGMTLEEYKAWLSD
jgi:hypothetical protein